MEKFHRELAAFLLRRARSEYPGYSPWMTCIMAARSPERAGDVDCLRVLRAVAVNFPVVLTTGH
jgi:hypothetical protein